MLLALEVGNTTTTLALSSDAGQTWDRSWRLVSDRELTADDWAAKVWALAAAAGITMSAINAVAISSVVPAITATLTQWSTCSLGLVPLVVTAALDLGVELLVDTPPEVGTDRLCNAAAAWERCGTAIIVIDAGTATKVEAITARGQFLGGAIAVGLRLSLDALAARAARLYAVPLEPPPSVIGGNTVHAVQAGVVRGHALMIEGLITAFRAELGPVHHILLTGGYSATLHPLLPSVTAHLPELTLDGIGVVYRRHDVTSQPPGG